MKRTYKAGTVISYLCKFFPADVAILISIKKFKSCLCFLRFVRHIHNLNLKMDNRIDKLVKAPVAFTSYIVYLRLPSTPTITAPTLLSCFSAPSTGQI